jgi:DNA polymerase-3 subunit alpha
MTMTHAAMMDQVTTKKKSTVSGQMSLFDIVSEEDRSDYEIKYPDVGEFPKEMMLGFEKEVLGIYLSGHPLEEYLDKIKKNVTVMASDFVREEETGEIPVADNAHVIVGGLIAEKTVKFTRNNKAMAFISLEDLTGTVEVIIFPKDYERYQSYLNTDAKVFVVGHATVEDEQNGKIICERIVSFEETEKELWLQFATMEEYQSKEKVLFDILYDSDGADDVILYVANPKSIKRLGKNQTVSASLDLVSTLKNFLGEKNVKVVEKGIENRR